MAQLERLSRSSSRSPRTHNAPTFEQLFHGSRKYSNGEVSNGRLSSSSHIYDHEDHNKKSVLMKVKETANKLRRSLSGKRRQGLGMDDENTSLGSKRVDAAEDNADPEYLGAPMYESEQAPQSLKETSRQHPRANPVVPENHTLSSCLKSEVKHGQDTPVQEKERPTLAHCLAPKVAGLTITNSNEQEREPHSGEARVATSAATGSRHVSNDNGLKHSQRKSEIGQHSANSSQKWAKDEKSLSQVISDSLSPKRAPGHGVVKKVREAVSSFLFYDEESRQAMESTDKSSPNTSGARKPQNRQAYYTTNPISSQKNALGNRKNPSPNVSVPTTSPSEVVEEQTLGRILQTN